MCFRLKIPGIALVLIVCTLFFSGVPSDATVIGDCNGVHNAANIFGGFLVSINGHFNNLDRQLGALGSTPQFCANVDPVAMLPFGAKLSSQIEMHASTANPAPFQLTAWPTVGQIVAPPFPVLDRINRVARIEVNDGNIDGRAFANEQAGGKLPVVFHRNLLGFRSINPVLMTLNDLGPIIESAIDFDSFILPVLSSADSISSQVNIVPKDSPRTGETRVADTGKYELVAECSNLAVRVIWDTGVVVLGQAVGSHDRLILRKIENNDGPRNDLGGCRIRHKHHESQDTFPHVSFSSGEASLFGFKFDDSDEKAPTCLGCTLLVSDDGRHWYEIIAVQEALVPTKHDR